VFEVARRGFVPAACAFSGCFEVYLFFVRVWCLELSNHLLQLIGRKWPVAE